MARRRIVRTLVVACLVGASGLSGAAGQRVARANMLTSCDTGCCQGGGCVDPEDYECCYPGPGEAACSQYCPKYCQVEECDPR